MSEINGIHISFDIVNEFIPPLGTASAVSGRRGDSSADLCYGRHPECC